MLFSAKIAMFFPQQICNTFRGILQVDIAGPVPVPKCSNFQVTKKNVHFQGLKKKQPKGVPPTGHLSKLRCAGSKPGGSSVCRSLLWLGIRDKPTYLAL